MINIAICDDNKAFAGYLENRIVETGLKDLYCEVFLSGEDLLRGLAQENICFQIYFLDIEMPGFNGIETARTIRQRDGRALIIFITEHKEYVYQVFEALPFRFLVKPVCKQDFDRVFSEALRHITAVTKLFFFKIEREQFQIPYDEILYFESSAHKLFLYTESQKYAFYGKLSDIEKQLDSLLFCRIHKSYLVNMEFIRSIAETKLLLKGGITLPISKPFRSSVRVRHLNFIGWRCGN